MTFQQLADELITMYGPLASSVHQCYTIHNPLKTDQPMIYWENVRIFLHELHTILYTRDQKHNIEIIPTDAYFFLCKMCVDRSFTVADLINIRNDRTVKFNKNIANDLSHNVLPQYITARRQFDYTGIAPMPCPGPVSAPPMQPMPMPIMPMMPMQHMSMMHPMMQMQMPPMHPMMQIPSMQPVTHASTTDTNSIRTRPRILRRIDAAKPFLKDIKDIKRDITVPIHNLKDEFPLDFYAMHRCDADASVPEITSVPNRPPPPPPLP